MDHSMLRARARENLRNNWALSIGVAAIAFLLGGMISGVTFFPQISSNTKNEFLQNLNHILNEGIRIGNLTVGFRSGILGFAAFLLGGVIELGYARFLLNQHDGEPLSWQDLFSQFDRFGQGFAQFFLRNLYIFLWSLLLVIPGIVKSLSYSMTPYIMADQPELSAGEAIEKSKLMMDGHKWDLFVLELSFIGWSLLAAMSLNIGNLVLNPYRNAATTAFYRQLVAKHRYL